MSESAPKKKKREMSPEHRQKLSQLAKERHARGELGGAKFGKLGGRPKRDRAAKRVAESAQDDATAKQIINVFKDAIAPDQPMGIRLKAAEAWLGVEREEAKVAIQEADSDSKQHSREELIELLSHKLSSGPAAAIIAKQLDQEIIPEAEVIDE